MVHTIQHIQRLNKSCCHQNNIGSARTLTGPPVKVTRNSPGATRKRFLSPSLLGWAIPAKVMSSNKFGPHWLVIWLWQWTTEVLQTSPSSCPAQKTRPRMCCPVWVEPNTLGTNPWSPEVLLIMWPQHGCWSPRFLQALRTPASPLRPTYQLRKGDCSAVGAHQQNPYSIQGNHINVYTHSNLAIYGTEHLIRRIELQYTTATPPSYPQVWPTAVQRIQVDRAEKKWVPLSRKSYALPPGSSDMALQEWISFGLSPASDSFVPSGFEASGFEAPSAKWRVSLWGSGVKSIYSKTLVLLWERHPCEVCRSEFYRETVWQPESLSHSALMDWQMFRDSP